MNICFDEVTKIFYLDTRHTTYAFFVNELFTLEHLYYGASIPHDDLRGICFRRPYSFAPYERRVGDCVSPDIFLQELPAANAGDYRAYALSLLDENGKYGCRMHYVSHAVYAGRRDMAELPCARGEGADSLEIVLKNKAETVEVRLIYVVWAEEDVIAKHIEIKNCCDREIHVLKAAAGVDLWGSDFDLVELYGTYHCERADVQRTPVKRGMQGSFSNKGASGHESNPFFALCAHNADENRGEVYGFNLMYSGNFKNEVQRDKNGNIRIVSGVSDYEFDWLLAPDETFCAPEVVMTFSESGLGGMSRNFHDFIRRHVIDPRFAFSSRPILLNTWEAFGFDIDEERILSLADRAKEIGAELLVVDDGWFRSSETEGLGDFCVCREKFPSGLGVLAEKVRAKGLRFGLWVEPEMVSRSSNLYQTHREWVICSDDVKYLGRSQLVLDMGNPAVIEYLYDRLCLILDEVRPDYLKWDMNRYISEAGSLLPVPQGEVMHRYVLGVYLLFRLITKRYPELLIETCAGGGGRFDLGMLYFSPQIWTSDNTDPFTRTDIQLGTSLAYPPSCMGSHLTRARVTGLNASEDFRYTAASFGLYGYELDPTELSAPERRRLSEFSRQYREEEAFVLKGDFYRLIGHGSGNFAAYLQVTKDKSRALFTLIQFLFVEEERSKIVRMRGLDTQARYRCSLDGKIYSGSVLMNLGLRIGDMEHQSGKAVRILFERV